MPRRITDPEDDVAQLTLPTFAPRVRYEPLILRQANGDFLIKPGKPIIEDVRAEDEITAVEFAAAAKISLRYVNQLCDEGIILHRRRSPRPRSHYLIPRAELARFEALTKAERT